MAVIEPSQYNETERLGDLLKRFRLRISPACRSLGAFLRLPARIGKPVTQEEVSEAAGISRQWYAVMEGNHVARVSASALGRTADALMVNAEERAVLFRLALPELSSAVPSRTSIDILEMFGSVRRVTRRLWTASSEAEVLTIVREYAMTEVRPDVMATHSRREEGEWDFVSTAGPEDQDSRMQFVSFVRRLGGPTLVDELYCYTLLTQPGEMITRAELDSRFPKRAERLRPPLDSVNRAQMSLAMASIRSQHGFVARLTAYHNRAHSFSEIERAKMSTLAELASLALS